MSSPLPPGPVLVTGGTGFLGSELVRTLRAAGVETHVLARATSPREGLEGLEVVWHVGDLNDPEAIDRALAAVSARARADGARAHVIHSGAVISYRSEDRELQRAVNVEGTRHVLDAARRHGVGRVVHVSSVVAVGHAETTTPLTEDAPYNLGGRGVAYADTKRAAEELVLAAAGDLDVVVVNPGAVFGPPIRASNTARFLRQVMAGHGPILAPPGGLGVVGLEDTVSATLAALAVGRRGERYILVESNWTHLELFRLAASKAGTRRPYGALAPGPWPLVLAAARAIDRVRPARLATPQALTMLGLRMHFDASKARAELGWSPEPFDRVLTRTMEALAR